MTARLPSCTSRDVERVLLHVGFFFRRQVGSHRIFEHVTSSHRVTVPMHNKDLKRKTVHAIIKQAGMTKEEFHMVLLGRTKWNRVA